MTLFKTTLISLVSLAKFISAQDVISVHGERTYCDNSPCKNGASCEMRSSRTSDSPATFFCECGPDWAGVLCDIPHPRVYCGTQNITVTVDKRLVSEHNLDDSNSHISFNEMEDVDGCQAISDSDNFVLTLQSPFNKNCGTKSSRGDDGHGNYIFNNRVTWKKLYPAQVENEAPIVRSINLLDFTCSYEDEYLIHYVPIKPAESVIEEKVEKGDFKVKMGLYKQRTFAENTAYSANPIIAIDEQVCVQMELTNDLGLNDLVLSVKDCWASGVANPTDAQKHVLIEKKCEAEAEYSVDLILNGQGAKTQFCFTMFKWQEDMDQVYLQCKVNICDSTVLHNGLSQCQCAPEGFGVNSWIYPNYYNAQLDYYNPGVGNMYADDANYGAYYYYDYLNPLDDFETAGSTDAARKKRAVTDADIAGFDAPSKKKRIDTKQMIKDEDGSLTLQNKNGDSIKVLTIADDSDILDISFGPINVLAKKPTEAEWAEYAKVTVHEINDDGDWFPETDPEQYTILIAVGVALIACMIVLGIVIGAYVQCKRKWDKETNSKIQDLNKARAFYQGVLKPNGPTYSNPGDKKEPAFIKNPEE